MTAGQPHRSWEGVTEALKASDKMEWAGHMNSIRQRAGEMALDELVYAR